MWRAAEMRQVEPARSSRNCGAMTRSRSTPLRLSVRGCCPPRRSTKTRSKIYSAEVRSGVASFGRRLAVYGLELPPANLGEISLEEEVEQGSNHGDDREAHQFVPARSD
jgi:hypothetical protein